MLGRFKEISPFGPVFSSQSRSLMCRAIVCPENREVNGKRRCSVGLKNPSWLENS